MVSPFLVFRASVFGLFIVFNTVLCTVGAWNLGFAQEIEQSRLAPVDAFIIFNGALGLIAIFPIIFTEVFRRGALTSRVWFELSWISLFWVLNLAAAVAISCVALDETCHHHPSGDIACTSSKVLIAFTWLNGVFLFIYFVLLAFFSILHQREDMTIWHSASIDVPWFATKQCIRSAPSSPAATLSRFARAKPASIVVPKPRRAGPPPPIFVHQRAGLGSQVEIEHFNDAGIIEAQAFSPSLSQPALAYSSNLYPHQVQRTHQNHSTTYMPASYTTNQKRDAASSPPPLGEWPRTDSTSRKKRDRGPVPTPAARQIYKHPEAQMSERALGKQRATEPPSRSVSGASTSSSRRGPPLEPLEINRSYVKPAAASPTSSQDSPSRSRPGGPRKKTTSNGFVRPRPPPLDLTRNGSTPNVRR